MCCNNNGALSQSSKLCKRGKTGASQADLLRTLRTLKAERQHLCFTYKEVEDHTDVQALAPLDARGAAECRLRQAGKASHLIIYRSMMSDGLANRGQQLLPLKQATVFISAHVVDFASEVRFCFCLLGEREARAFYTATPAEKGGLAGPGNASTPWTGGGFGVALTRN